MRFELTEDQRDFAAALDALLSASDTVGAARAWAAGDHAPGLGVWKRLADMGVQGLLVAEEDGGTGAGPVELVIAFEALGRHAVPGPWIESAAYLPTAVSDGCLWDVTLGGEVATVAVPPLVPFAVDADAAGRTLVVTPDGLMDGVPGSVHESIDPTRRLFDVQPQPDVRPWDTVSERAFDVAALACAAQLLGAGERVLAESVSYVKQRHQFGRPIGSFQAVKHQLADVRIALDFARPLLYAAALGVSTSSTNDVASPDEGGAAARDVSAAKVACADAAWLAARTALQVHGAVGYTRELDLGLWILRIRALVPAWGTPAFHRARVLESLTRGGAE